MPPTLRLVVRDKGKGLESARDLIRRYRATPEEVQRRIPGVLRQTTGRAVRSLRDSASRELQLSPDRRNRLGKGSGLSGTGRILRGTRRSRQQRGRDRVWFGLFAVPTDWVKNATSWAGPGSPVIVRGKAIPNSFQTRFSPTQRTPTTFQRVGKGRNAIRRVTVPIEDEGRRATRQVARRYQELGTFNKFLKNALVDVLRRARR